MGTRHRVGFAVYTTFGSINCQLAEKTGFTAGDADLLKEALRTLFENDASSARPDGSMEVLRLYWWQHNCKSGQYPSPRCTGCSTWRKRPISPGISRTTPSPAASCPVWRPKSMTSPDGYLQMSGIQHFSFCRRQWALACMERPRTAENTAGHPGRRGPALPG